MHEMALCESILQIVQENARQRAIAHINSVRIEVGALAAVEPNALMFCFDAVTRGTIAEGAKLDIVTVPGQAWCLSCSKQVAVTRPHAPCPLCGDAVLKLSGGDELRVKDMEVE